MTCELCGKENAAVRIRQIIGTESKELRICEICARKQGIIGTEKGLGEGIAWLLQGLFEQVPEKISHAAACPLCGIRFRDIRANRRVGCSQCYITFNKEIHKLLKSSGKPQAYQGKLPRRVLEYKSLLIDRENLKTRLKEALQNEDYEKAAILRDEIQGFDGGPEASR
jgi:protein arginine kinase activator